MDFDRFVGAAARLLILPFYRRKLRQFESLLARAKSVQRHALLSKIERCRDTEFGRDHNFAKIRTIEDFRREVPLSTYADVAPYIDKVGNGQQSALFPESEKVVAFACTAGTTGRPKNIPITQSWLEEYRRSWEVWGVKAVIDCPDMVGKRWLQISGPEKVDVTPSGLPIGMVSAVTARFQSALVRSFYVGPLEIANIQDPLAHYYTILRLSIGTNVGFIATITAANLIRLADVGNDCHEVLIRDLHDGTLCRDLNIPDDIRRKIDGAVLVKRPRRARELASIVARTGTLYPKDYWPLALLACWLGGTVGYQSRSLRKYYGDVALRDLGYVSTEGRHTIPLSENSTEGVLAVDGSYYEFVPAEFSGVESPNVFEGHELQVGRDYEVFVTTSSGLYRHDLGDVVRCNGFIGEAPILEFLHKSGQHSDLEGEKISSYQIAKAVDVACEHLGIQLESFSAIPVRPQTGAPYYALLVDANEFEDRREVQDFLDRFDKELIAMNVMYKQKRNDLYLERPRMRFVAAGTWAKFAGEATDRRGTGETQYKHPVLLAHGDLPSWLEVVEEM